MNNDEVQKAVSLISKSKYIALLLPREPSLDMLVSAEVLARSLGERGKRVGFLADPSLSGIEETDLLHVLANPPILPKEFIVSLNTEPAPVSQLRYEKADGRIDVIFAPESDPIRQEYVSFREGGVQCDAVVVFGLQDIGLVAAVSGIGEAFFAKIPMIVLDRASANRRYGESNLIEPNLSFAEMLFALLGSFSEAGLSSEAATLLLAGVLATTDGLRSSPPADTLENVSELIRAGADYAAALRAAERSVPFSRIQLIGRALTRSKEDRAHSYVWSFLTTEDFQKTGLSSDEYAHVLSYLKHQFPRQPVHILVWQYPPGGMVSAAISADASVLERIGEKSGGIMKDSLLLIDGKFADFREAEESLAILLEGAL